MLKSLHLPFLSLVLGSSFGCGPAAQNDVKSTENSKRRPIAEYEPTRALLLATGWGRGAAFESAKDSSKESETKRVKRGTQEFIGLIETLVRTQKEMPLYLHAYLESNPSSTVPTELELWQPEVQAWNQSGASIDLFEVTTKDFPGVDQEDLSEDSWTRDYGSYTILEDGQRKELARTQRGEYVNRILAGKLDRSIEIHTGYFEGGAFMNTSDGVCAFSADGKPFAVHSQDSVQAQDDLEKVFLEAFGCRKLLTMPSLPNEGTTHIDLFAKFVDDRRVLLASYPNDDVILEKTMKQIEYRCSDQAIAAKNWTSCDYVASKGEVPFLENELTVSSESDLQKVLKEKLDNLPSDYRHGKLREHLAQVKDRFVSEGFAIIEVVNPQPTVQISLDIYRDHQGKTVHRTVYSDFTHRSYTNSLLSNGHLYLPTYEEFPELNKKAHEVYETMGFAVYDVDMSVTIKRGGAVHCLTKDIH